MQDQSIDPGFGHWFAGFVDGEAHFAIDAHHVPRFAIALRADDRAILEDLRQRFGGRICFYQPSGPAGASPACRWQIASKRELAGLVGYFDAFPLRSKKARDYHIWRRAVHVYCAHGGRHEELTALRWALMEGRAYDADEPDPVDPFEVQMALEIN